MTEVIAAGVSLLLVHPILVLVPVLTDLYYWMGWAVTPVSLVEWLQVQFLAEGSERSIKAVDQIASYSDVDLTQIVAWSSPSLLAGADQSELFRFAGKPTVSPDSPWQIIAVIVLMFILMGGLFALVSVPLADAVTRRTRTARTLANAVGVAWYRFLGLALSVLLIVLAVAVPAALLWTLLVASIGLNIAVLLVPLVTLAVVALLVLLFFSPEAIVVSEKGVVAAMRASRDVTRQNLMPTLALTGASLLLTIGLGEVWMRMASSAPGLVLAVLANAFVGCGLAMASMIFYFERIGVPPVNKQPGEISARN